METTFPVRRKEEIKKFIDTHALMSIRINGQYVRAKWLEHTHIVVRVGMNLFNEGFLNGDICEVMAELENGNLFLKRLNDGHSDIVEKKYVQYPLWGEYDL